MCEGGYCVPIGECSVIEGVIDCFVDLCVPGGDLVFRGKEETESVLNFGGEYRIDEVSCGFCGQGVRADNLTMPADFGRYIVNCSGPVEVHVHPKTEVFDVF